MRRIVDGGRYNPESSRLAEAFVDDIGHQIGVCLPSLGTLATHAILRARRSRSRGRSHRDRRLGLQEYRGFPLSIDLADAACRAMFGAGTFDNAVASAYREHGEPLRYLPERNTREK